MERVQLSVASPLKAFGVALAVDLLALPVALVLVYFWPLFILALVPYLAGRLGARYAPGRQAVQAGALAGAVMVTVLVAVFLSLLASLQPHRFELLEPVGLSLVAAGYLLAMVFGALGGRHGAAAMEEGG